MDFDGTWDITVNSPMGGKRFRITVATEGGAVAGTISSDGMSAPLLDPVVADGHFRWSIKLPRPMNILLEMDLTRDGDALSGVAKAGHMALPGVTGVRVG
ncbi:hypothetical protein METEAL_26160 [Mesoterricola silvestris]|uniref:Uncharacterized protein n=2 Tax=Mesoterricola silvestris TaxID=2927979 RepID=A0AA48GSZ1_9BACT|nr:hypothetical protein METEAL_26160 [Mesoterricola silvestris]